MTGYQIAEAWQTGREGLVSETAGRPPQRARAASPAPGADVSETVGVTHRLDDFIPGFGPAIPVDEEIRAVPRDLGTWLLMGSLYEQVAQVVPGHDLQILVVTGGAPPASASSLACWPSTGTKNLRGEPR